MRFRDPDVHIPLVCIGLWLLGVWALNGVLKLAGSEYPMINATTENPDYNPLLDTQVRYMEFGWTAVCLVVGVLWFKARRR